MNEVGRNAEKGTGGPVRKVVPFPRFPVSPLPRFPVSPLLRFMVLGAWSALALLPLYWIFCTAFKPPTMVLQMPPEFFPVPFTVVNFKRVFAQSQIWRWMFNSAVVAGTVTISNVLLSTLAGYTLAKKRFPGNRIVFWTIIAMMLVPGQLTIIPLYELIIRLNWTNTYKALIVPALVGPFGIFMMKQFLQTLPGELFDAARIDGCGELRTFSSIVLPLARPGMAVLAIFTFTAEWNDFLWPLITINQEPMMTLQIGLQKLQNDFFTDYGLLMAGAATAALPMIAVFLAFQKAFVRGVTIGALKG